MKRDAQIGQANADRDARIQAARAMQEAREAEFVAETKVAEPAALLQLLLFACGLAGARGLAGRRVNASRCAHALHGVAALMQLVNDLLFTGKYDSLEQRPQ